MTEGDSDSRLLVEASAFADRLNALIAAVLPGDQPTFLAEVSTDGTIVVAPTSGELARQPLRVAIRHTSRRALFLRVEYICHWDGSERFLSIVESSIRVSLKDVNEPLIRFHYQRSQRAGELPAAHVHVHGHRDEVLYLLTLADAGRPKGRRTKDEMPRLSALHIPVGGERFRPSLEDMIEILGIEFGADLKDGWKVRIADEREVFRRVQLRAAVRDAPEEAVASLEALGYRVVSPSSPAVGTSDVLRRI